MKKELKGRNGRCVALTCRIQVELSAKVPKCCGGAPLEDLQPEDQTSGCFPPPLPNLHNKPSYYHIS